MPIINPFIRRVCYRCYRPITLADCALVVNPGRDVDDLGQTVAPEVLRQPSTGIRRYLSFVYAPSETSSYQEIMWKCPHCDYLLPYNIVSTKSFIVGVIGARSAGKSHLIARMFVCLQQLSDDRISAINIVNTRNEQQGRERYRDWLVGDRQLNPTEKHERNPLVFRISNRDGSLTNLIISDFHGEMFIDNAEMRTEESVLFVSNVDGFIMLIDPTNIDIIHDQLPLWMQEEPRHNDIPEHVTILNNLTQTLQLRSIPHKIAQFFKISVTSLKPTLFVVSKADTLLFIRNARNTILSEFRDTNRTIDMCDPAIRSWMTDDLNAQAYINQSTHYQPNRFAVVSATGNQAFDGLFVDGQFDGLMIDNRVNGLLSWLYRQHVNISPVMRFIQLFRYSDEPGSLPHASVRRARRIMIVIASILVIFCLSAFAVGIASALR
jgi:hypothetical protein